MATAKAGYGVYRVRPGDNILTVAQKFGLSPELMLAYNWNTPAAPKVGSYLRVRFNAIPAPGQTLPSLNTAALAQWNQKGGGTGPKSGDADDDADAGVTPVAARTEMQTALNGWGVGALMADVDALSGEGYTNLEQMLPRLSQTETWKTRFKGNNGRQTKLAPDAYLKLEDQYKAVLQSYGLGADFYDSPDDFASFIERDLAPTEVANRAQRAWEWTHNADSRFKETLFAYYPELARDDSFIVKWVLDPARAESILARQDTTARIGANAARQHLAVSKADVERWVDRGVTVDAAEQGLASAAELASSSLGGIAGRFGESYTAADAVGESLDGLASARRKRERLSASEQGAFSGAAGGARIQRATDGSF